jgi:hypothetical protein
MLTVLTPTCSATSETDNPRLMRVSRRYRANEGFRGMITSPLRCVESKLSNGCCYPQDRIQRPSFVRPVTGITAHNFWIYEWRENFQITASLVGLIGEAVPSCPDRSAGHPTGCTGAWMSGWDRALRAGQALPPAPDNGFARRVSHRGLRRNNATRATRWP